MVLSKNSSALFLVCLMIIVCVSARAQILPPSEVEALKRLAKAIEKRNWDFTVDPCSGTHGWNMPDNHVICDCSYEKNTTCHVINIELPGESLPGMVPKDLTGLPFLQQLDLKRNLLSGTIPLEWGSSKLVRISLSGNRITGSIPRELGNITTLETLAVEMNELSGTLPLELGKLTRLRNLLISSNNLTGKLPATLANLKALKEVRIDDNQFSGVIPDFIQNWTKLEKIHFQATGLSGPIPSGIARLTELTEIRFSDLGGPEGTFPPVYNNMTKLESLLLRNCNLNGTIPDLKGIPSLRSLDLSFNKLSGTIPSSLSNLSLLEDLFLTGNMLSGPVPDPLLSTASVNIDLSYNNIATGTSTCQHGKVNLFASSSGANISGVASCLRRRECAKISAGLHINCGGGEITINGTKYDKDNLGTTSSFFSKGNTFWGFSNTGFFTDTNKKTAHSYILTNTTRITGETPELYATARISPMSLVYYAFCLVNGSYTVRLHFAETMFRNNQTYSSLGRRVFDIYIQGKQVLKDFNIAAEAGGTDKVLVKKFSTNVTSSTLTIRFYWAGKGTRAIPHRGVYGPLVSAISVDPNFVPTVTPPAGESGVRLSVRAVIGIVAAGALALLAIVGLLWWNVCLRKKNDLNRDLEALNLDTGKFTLRQIKAATNDFDVANKIGEGGFGSVYKGLLSDGTTIAVKQLSSSSKQGNREFLNEIAMFSALQHPNLVRLYGCCVEADQLLLVYEFMENNNVGRALFGPEASQINLDWPTRSKICVGIARGLAFLHEELRLKIVHRDIKATNILLDKDLNPKISDFGLAKLDEEGNSRMNTRIAGTYGYMAPEYAMRGQLTDKADVYSYGIVVLEIVSGRSNTTCTAEQSGFYILNWALNLNENDNLKELVDPRLGADYDIEEVSIILKLALQCARVSPAARPSMSSVVSVLEGRSPLEDVVTADDIASANQDLAEMRRRYEAILEETQTL